MQPTLPMPKILLALFLASLSGIVAGEKLPIRLGVLAFGTANWQLPKLRDNLHPTVALKVTPLANPAADEIALQAGGVDMIIADWVWVAKMRATGADFAFYPYSATSGMLLVAKDSAIKSLADLDGAKLGIAGGELDKNWLLLQTLLQQKYPNRDFKTIEKIYGAPPLLNQQILRGRLDAIINYWHYGADLEAKGYQQLLDGNDILRQLGVSPMPMLGFVFKRQWARKNPQAINYFLAASANAHRQLCQSDIAWQQAMRPHKKPAKTQQKLRHYYCQGQIKQWGQQQLLAAQQIYTLLQNHSQKLTGTAKTLPSDIFWNMRQ